MTAHRLVATMCLTALLSASCGNPQDEKAATGIAYEEFLSSVYQEPDTGLFIANGDEVFDGEKQLRELYDQAVRGDDALIVDRVGMADNKWSDTQKLNLTYCISNSFAAARKAEVVTALSEASADWESAANVNFVYVPAQDATCTNSNNNVVFDVRPVTVNGQFLARAFLPNNSRSGRSLLIDSTAFGTNWTLRNLLAHELGHALGFRHEHIRPETGVCSEANNWRALTVYDSDSIMHYPHCNGTNAQLTMSARDRQGALILYGAPSGQPPQPPSIATVELGSGTVDRAQSVHFPPFNARGGTGLVITMTGTKDPDLYVRFGAPPTTSTFHCRPYTTGASETCVLNVPNITTAVYVMVRGFGASRATYSVTAQYVLPP